MTAQVNENVQYVDPTTGELLVNGYIYIGTNNLDAKLNPITIYSDRELTTAISNPQRTGSDGRSENKIWVDGKYSLKVEDSSNVQKLNDLSLGELTQTNNTTLINVQGADSITADGSPTVTSLVSNQVYIFTAASANTGAVTLTIDLTTTYPIKKQHDKDLVANDIEANQTVAVIWNSTDSVFELMTNSAIEPVDLASTQTITGDKTFTGTTALSGPNTLSGVNTLSGKTTATANFVTSKGADIASATALTLGTDGNSFDVTGTTTITSIATVGVGTHVTLQFDGILTLTHHATDLILPSGANITTAAGDIAVFYEYATGDWRCVSYSKASGQAISVGQQVVQVVNVTDGAVATGATLIPYDDTIPQNTEGDEYMTLAITPTNASNILVIDVVVQIGIGSAEKRALAALFQDSTAGALAAGIGSKDGTTDEPLHISFKHYMVAGTTSSTTFKIRAGTDAAGTNTFNGAGSARRYGGVLSSSITITEHTA